MPVEEPSAARREREIPERGPQNIIPVLEAIRPEPSGMSPLPRTEHPQSSPSPPTPLAPYPSPAHAALGPSLPPCRLLAGATPGLAAEMEVWGIFPLRAALHVYRTSHPEGTRVLYGPSISIIHRLPRSSRKRSSPSVALTPRDTLAEEGQK